MTPYKINYYNYYYTCCVQGVATTVLAEQVYVWPVPDSWSLCQAATVPLAYSLAYLGVYVRGRLAPGDSLVVVGAGGPVGQAVLAIPTSHQQVTAVVGSEQERELLQDSRVSTVTREQDYLGAVTQGSRVLVVYADSQEHTINCLLMSSNVRFYIQLHSAAHTVTF